ncbi:MAG: MarR family transcriptional regulator [Bryobacteraceae bacterium]|nr:MarR family transcriptional regulator [Bryobacteraceae bacterium]
MDRANDLSPRQRETLDWVKNFIHEKHMPPSVREIGEAFGIKSSSVFDLLKALERKGYITRESRKARSIVVLDRSGASESQGRGPRKR